MQLVEKHVINRQHQFWSQCDWLAFCSKHLYNCSNYVQRQYFFETKKYYNSIEVTLIEESYTSIASAIDGDILPIYPSNAEKKPVFSGKRIQRGLYKTATGRIINADINGSMNIVRKVIPDAFEGIVGLPFIPVILELWTKITNVVV